MVLAFAIEMNREGQVLRRRELRQTPLEFQGIRAQVDVLLARNEAVDDLHNLRMQQRLAARKGDHGRAALIHRGKALLRGQLLLKNVGRILHLAAAGARQVAAEERLQHQHQGIALYASELLLQDIR